jgi:NitT/TauT family transport system permease protein
MGAARLTLTAALGRPTAAVPTGWLWQLVSVGIVAISWEIAGRVPISFAFPTFIDTVVAFGRLTASGELPRAYL